MGLYYITELNIIIDYSTINEQCKLHHQSLLLSFYFLQSIIQTYFFTVPTTTYLKIGLLYIVLDSVFKIYFIYWSFLTFFLEDLVFGDLLGEFPFDVAAASSPALVIFFGDVR